MLYCQRRVHATDPEVERARAVPKTAQLHKSSVEKPKRHTIKHRAAPLTTRRPHIFVSVICYRNSNFLPSSILLIYATPGITLISSLVTTSSPPTTPCSILESFSSRDNDSSFWPSAPGVLDPPETGVLRLSTWPGGGFTMAIPGGVLMLRGLGLVWNREEERDWRWLSKSRRPYWENDCRMWRLPL